MEIDWEEEYKNLTRFNKTVTITLTYREEMDVVLKWLRRYPQAVKNMQAAFDSDMPIRCPFPVECDRFPCKSMHCNADTLSNGCPYRMS